MTLEEAICHARMTAETREDLCEECRKEHLQLADWLQELQESRELINRQQAEIEKLKAEIERLEFSNEHWNDWEVKCRAINEFAERLKTARVEHTSFSQNHWYEIDDTFINELVKEMTEVQNDTRI